MDYKERQELTARRVLHVKVMLQLAVRINLSINTYIGVLWGAFFGFSVHLLVLWGRIGNRNVASVLQVFTLTGEVV